uniref:RING-type domain-containing protein n=1 Tax=viral metagenome TaxID=1070528 RepID=A0A6C0D8Y8_9ZZZZ
MSNPTPTGKTSQVVDIIYNKYSASFIVANNEHTELFQQKWRLLDSNYEENFEKFQRGETYDLNDDYFYLKKKYAVEVADYELKMKELTKISDKLEKHVFNLGASFIYECSTKRKINNIKRKMLEKNVCGICCENHELKHIITTCCNHHFGKYCLAKFIDYNFENYLEIICPMCRNDDITKLTKYK